MLNLWTSRSFRLNYILISFAWSCSILGSVLAAQNVTLFSNAPQLLYTPSVCNASIATTLATPIGCGGLWYNALLPQAPAVVVRRTDGLVGNTGIIPQLFLSVRASAVYVFTSTLSTATVNVTASAAQAVVSARAAGGGLAVLNLSPQNTTTVTLTYTPPGRLDIASVVLTVEDPSASSSFLPSATIPPSASLPSPTLPTSSPSSGSGTNMRLALGLGLGLSVAVVAGALVALAWAWRRRKRRRDDEVWLEKDKMGIARGVSWISAR